jgi:hypothetical protein
MKTVQITARAGIRNDVSTERFGASDLLTGKNIDVDETGKVFRRLGSAKLADGAHHSLWSDGSSNTFFVRSGNLYRWLPSGSTELVAAGVEKDVVYAAVNNRVFLSDNKRALVVDEAGCRQWGVTPPLPTFSVQSTAGDMKAGTYGVTLVFVRDDGHESGAPTGLFITLKENQGILLGNLPVSDNPRVTHKRVYLTAPDGEVFYASGMYPNSDTSATIRSIPSTSMTLRTQFKTCASAGQIVGHFGGRSFVADGQVLSISDPFDYELFDMRTGFAMMEAPITLVAPVSDGVYIGTTKEIVFVQGFDPTEWALQLVAPYGAIRGTLVYPANDQVTDKGIQNIVAMWFSQRGVCIGASSGEMVNLTSNRFVAPSAKAGAGLFKVRGGTPQYLVTLYS